MTDYPEPAGNPQVFSNGHDRLLIFFPSQLAGLPPAARGALREYLERGQTKVEVREVDVAEHWIWVHTTRTIPEDLRDLAWCIWRAAQTALMNDGYPYGLPSLPEPTLTTQDFCVCHVAWPFDVSVSLNLWEAGLALKPAGIAELRECLPSAIGELTFSAGILCLTRQPNANSLEWVPAVTELLARLMELVAAVDVRLLIKFDWPQP